MEIGYTKEPFHTYMTIRASKEEAVYEEKMLSNHKSDVLAPFHIRWQDGEKYYYYDITGKIDLESYLQKQAVTGEFARMLVQKLLLCAKVVDEYLLDLNELLLEAKYIYIDSSDMEMQLICYPGYDMDFHENLKELVSRLLVRTDHTKKEGVLYVYQLFQTVRQDDFCIDALAKIEEVLIEQEPAPNGEKKISIPADAQVNDRPETIISEEKEETEVHHRYLWVPIGIGLVLWMLMIAAYMTGWLKEILMRLPFSVDARIPVVGMTGILCLTIFLVTCFTRSEKEPPIWDESNQGELYTFTDTTIPSVNVMPDTKTMVLGARAGTIHLISLNQSLSKDLYIKKLPCVVGSHEDADCRVMAIGISRHHACFESMDSGIRVSDLESTNGTFVNGNRLKAGEKMEILTEDIIAFGEVKYMYVGA